MLFEKETMQCIYKIEANPVVIEHSFYNSLPSEKYEPAVWPVYQEQNCP